MSKQPDTKQKILRDIQNNLVGVYFYGDGLLESSRRVYASLARHREPSPDDYTELLSCFWQYYDQLWAALDALPPPPGLLHDESGVVSERWPVRLRRLLCDVTAWLHRTRKEDGSIDARGFVEALKDFWCPDDWGSKLARLEAFSRDVGAVIGHRKRAAHGQEMQLQDPPERLVTLLQAAAMVNRTKRQLERWARKKGFPRPRVLGGGGKPHEYAWSELRPFLEKESGRPLPPTFPFERFRPV